MDSLKYFMLTVFGLTSLVLVNAQAPKPCCTPPLYTTGLAILGHQPAQHGTPEQLYSQEGIYYFDKANTRLAVNVTVQMLNTQQPAQQVYEIQDFSKKMMYIIVDNQVCQKMPLSGDFPGNDCIPDNATFRGTVKLGDSYSVNRWLIEQPQVRQEISMADKCIPVTSALTVQQEGTTMVSQEYFNFKPTIDRPDAVFTPPSICNTAPISDMGNNVPMGRERRSMASRVMDRQKPFLL